ncbi:MAG TPA: hypothetical protein VEL07_14590 [Planctomycetota bacterium]|nr:hypothetical protein [Planctomycetota bacterium]
MSCADRRAFTLLEALIAVGLSSAIVLAASMALRVAAQSTALARRLSDENALIRAGMGRAHAELDFWSMLDDPDAPTAQPLRAVTAGQGLAFTPLAAVAPPRAPPVPGPEDERGWDPTDPWAMHDPRGWYYGNPAEQDISDVRYGRYGAFANAEPAPVLAPLDFGAGANGYATPAVRHGWLFNQMRTLLDALGYYGYCEYMPANSLYVYYTSHNPSPDWQSGGTALGGLPLELVKPGIGKFASNDGHSGYPRGLYLLTFLASFAAPNADIAAARMQGVSRSYYVTGYGLTWDPNGVEYQRLIRDTETRRPLLPLAPRHWPRIDVSIQRFVRFARFTQIARVRWTSPLTGVAAELNFTGFSTTLRGARQQRRPTSGWARWDNDGTANDATLDTH